MAAPALAGVRVTDDRGQLVHLERPATRVIALYGAFNEILADLDREDILIARTETDDQPPSIRSKPVVGTHLRPNLELIISLKPDLVIQMGGRVEALATVKFLETHGIPTVMFRMDAFADLFSAMERLGVLTGAETQAQARILAMQAELKRIRTQRPGSVPTVFFEVRHPNLLAAGQGSMLTEIIDAAGGRNAVTAPEKLVRLSEEEVLRLDPDIYLIQHGPMNPAPTPLAARPHYATLDCVRNGRVITVDQRLFSRPGPRSLDAVRQLAEIVQKWDKEARP